MDLGDVTATFELPNLKKEDVNIDVQNCRLIVSSNTKVSSKDDPSGFATLSTTLNLPQGVKLEEVKASMKDGILTITFPNLDSELDMKKIRID